MSVAGRFLLKVRRAETPFYRTLKRMAIGVLTFEMPLPMPLRALYRLADGVVGFCHQTMLRFWVFFYRSPVFRSRCEFAGKRLSMDRIPYVAGHVRIRLGDDVKLSGQIDILAGRVFDEPEVVLGNRVFLGHGVTLRVARQIVIEEGVLVAGKTLLTDNDAHPLDPVARYQGAPPAPEEVKPVRVGRCAWIGTGCTVMKGVTIGEGAVIGAGSVVVNDIPPYSVAAGVPAKVLKTLEPPVGGLDAALAELRRGH